jgi:hypothetical protein
MVFGLGLSVPLLAANSFWFLFAMPIANGCSQAIWQTKVAPDVQGRVFAARSMMAYSIIPAAYLLAGPLVEGVFEPLTAPGAALAHVVGWLPHTGMNYAIALVFLTAGGLYILTALVILMYPRTRRLELELPDVLPEDTSPYVEASAAAPATGG